MVDMNALERQLADESLRIVGTETPTRVAGPRCFCDPLEICIGLHSQADKPVTF